MACHANGTRLAGLPSVCVEGNFVLHGVVDLDDDGGLGGDGGVGFERDGQVEGEGGERADLGSDEARSLGRGVLDGSLVRLVHVMIN